MPVAVSIERVTPGGQVIQAVAGTSNYAANAVCSITLAGATNQILAITRAIVTSTGATAAACVTLTISGVSTSEIASGTMSMVFGVPAGAGVPASPLVLSFDPPLVGVTGTAMTAQMAALGSGHAGAHINLLAKVIPG